MALIKDGKVVADDWTVVADDAPVPADGDVIVSMKRFSESADELKARSGRLGVRLDADDAPEHLEPHIKSLDLIAIDFPKYVDGRGYSYARLLRERYAFAGELRAVGNVLRDQLQFMNRCGFDAYELQEGKDVDEALAAFGEISVAYQAAADERLPLYRRR
jgi:uncharacterized protein (DUF934 family)